MVVAFGFGAGDFIAATKLLGQAAQALSRTSGATGQYQQATVELQSIRAVLQQVESLEVTRNNADIVQKIQFCSHVCHIPLSNFISKVKKFEKYLGPSACATNSRSVSRPVFRAGRKIHWPLCLERDVTELKGKIAPQIAAINALLELESLQCLKEVRQTTVAASKDTAAHLEQLQLSFDELKIQVESRLCSADQFTALQFLSPAKSSDGSHTSNGNSPILSHQIAIATAAIQSRLAVLEDMTNPLVYRSDLEAKIPTFPTMLSRGVLADDEGDASREARSVELVAHASSSEARVLAAHAVSSISELATRVVMMVLLLLPAVQRFLRSLQTITRSPTLLLQDNLVLEDALGRSLNLPYEHFRHWPVFYARLQEAFRDVPGETKVKHNQFHILNMQAAGNLVLTKKIWGSAVFPGSRLAMSMLYSSSEFETRSCPRCESVDDGRSKAEWTQCTGCSLTYRRLNVQRWPPTSYRSPQAVPEDIMDAVEFITATDDEWISNVCCHSEMQFFKRVHLIGNETIGKGERDDYERRKPKFFRSQYRTANGSPRGILRQPTRAFPNFPNGRREGISPRDTSVLSTIPPGARWTKIDRRLVNPEALEEAKERFEERREFVFVLRVLTKPEIEWLADRTRIIRAARADEGYKGAGSVWSSERGTYVDRYKVKQELREESDIDNSYMDEEHDGIDVVRFHADDDVRFDTDEEDEGHDITRVATDDEDESDIALSKDIYYGADDVRSSRPVLHRKDSEDERAGNRATVSARTRCVTFQKPTHEGYIQYRRYV